MIKLLYAGAMLILCEILLYYINAPFYFNECNVRLL